MRLQHIPSRTPARDPPRILRRVSRVDGDGLTLLAEEHTDRISSRCRRAGVLCAYAGLPSSSKGMIVTSWTKWWRIWRTHAIIKAGASGHEGLTRVTVLLHGHSVTMPRPEANQSPTWLFLHSTDATPSTFLFSIKAAYYFLHLPSFRLHLPARQPQLLNSHKTTMPVPPTPCTRSTQILLCPGCKALPAPKPTTYDLAHDACRVSKKRVCDTYLQEHPAGIRRTGWRSWGWTPRWYRWKYAAGWPYLG